MEKTMIKEKDKNDYDVFIGDLFTVRICSHYEQYYVVKVVKTDDELGYDVENADGDRCWNPFYVVRYNDKIGNIINNKDLFYKKCKVNIINS